MLRDDFLDGEIVKNRLKVWSNRLGRERTDQFMFVAENQKQLLGFICVYGNEDPKWGSLIDNLHVAHEHKRQGIGTFLMQQAGSWLKSYYGQSGSISGSWKRTNRQGIFAKNWDQRTQGPWTNPTRRAAVQLETADISGRAPGCLRESNFRFHGTASLTRAVSRQDIMLTMV